MKKELYSYIEIEATPERVWQVLTDTAAYPKWNPFIRSINGKIEARQRLEVFIMTSEKKGMTFKPTVLKAESGHELRWLGRLFISGLFDGEHFFKIERVGEGRVRFVQGEKFSGLLVGFLARQLDNNTLPGFRKMNAALKIRAEEKQPNVDPTLDWRGMMLAGRFAEAEPVMLAETGGGEGEWPLDPESQGDFYEKWGDALAPDAGAKEKYRIADHNYSIFASGATSGGEGTARMMDVNRVLKKMEDLNADR